MNFCAVPHNRFTFTGLPSGNSLLTGDGMTLAYDRLARERPARAGTISV
jgi:hypothetical protein